VSGRSCRRFPLPYCQKTAFALVARGKKRHGMHMSRNLLTIPSKYVQCREKNGAFWQIMQEGEWGDAFEVSRILGERVKSRRSPRTSPVWTNQRPLQQITSKKTFFTKKDTDRAAKYSLSSCSPKRNKASTETEQNEPAPRGLQCAD